MGQQAAQRSSLPVAALIAVWTVQVAYAGALLAPAGGSTLRALGVAVVWVPVVAAALVTRRCVAERRAVWLALAGLASLAVGLTVAGTQFFDPGATPALSVGDVGYVGFYLLLGAALLRRGREMVRGMGVAIDAPLATLAVMCVLSIPLSPLVDEVVGGRASAVGTVWLVYPVLDLLLAAAVVGVVLVARLRAVRWLWLVGGLGAIGVSDALFALTFVDAVDLVPGAAQLGYGLGTAALAHWVVLVACDRSQPSTAATAGPGATEHERRQLRAAVVSAVMATAAVVSLLVSDLVRPLPAAATALAAITVVTLGARSVLAFFQLSGVPALRLQARTDELTGLANRRELGHRASAALRDPARRHALVVLDLDGFKAVNDTYGHLAGDLVLVEVAARVAGVLREADVVARVGGDEFTVFLPDTEVDEASAVAQRIAAEIGRPVPVGEQVVGVTVSLGLAAAPRDGTDLAGLQAVADARMYRAKGATTSL